MFDTAEIYANGKSEEEMYVQTFRSHEEYSFLKYLVV